MSKKLIIILSILGVLVLAIVGVVLFYVTGTKPVDTSSEETKVIEITSGMGKESITDLLAKEGLINNSLVAKVYLKLNGVKNLQAGKYTLSQNMSLEEIFNTISEGKVKDETITITFPEGKNMNTVAKKIAENTNNTEEDVFSLLKDEEYINSLITKYWFLEDTIKNEDIYYPLEGYLFPDTYKFENKDVTVKTIFNILLNNTDKVLEKYKTQIENSNKSVHEILTMASIIELEGSGKEARYGISGVFYNRLKKNMSLGSDVTTYYAIKVDMGERNLYTSEINTYNPYNTRGPNMAGKLPVGPICNPSENSIDAALNPTESDYLYFVSDSKGKIYFTKTYQEHLDLVKNLQKQGLWYEYD